MIAPRHRSYYTLVASLPHLPHFSKADHLPINSVRLRERLESLLSPDDLVLVRRALDLVAWQAIPVRRSETETIALFRRLAEEPRLRPIVGFRADLRTVVAALRRRRQGRAAPRPGEDWGIGRLVPPIVRAWDQPFFGLERRLPWIRELAGKLEARESLATERFLFELGWRHYGRLAEGREFMLEGVLAYLFKWDILKRWLSYDPGRAEERFRTLMQGFLTHDDSADETGRDAA